MTGSGSRLRSAGTVAGLGVVLFSPIAPETASAVTAGTSFRLPSPAMSPHMLGAAPAAATSTTSANLSSASGGLTIVINAGPGLASNAQALVAFQNAAAEWSSRISDPITVTIDADLSTTAPGGGSFSPLTIGSTSAVELAGGYDLIRDQMVADAAAQPAALNNHVVTLLPTAAQFGASVVLPAGRTFDGGMFINKANAKAIGFTGLDEAFGASDATMVFNSAFSFDYDSSDGVSSDKIDFQSTAAHEIGHALGFTSVVDDIDGSTAAEFPGVSPTTLDLFRFGRSSGNPSTESEFTTFGRNLVPGVDTITDDLTNEYRMSTGLNFDGRQASHWKDDELTGSFIGVMDPTLAFGMSESVQDSDLRAIDLIGYDVQPVPEPTAALALLSFAGASLLARRRRQTA